MVPFYQDQPTRLFTIDESHIRLLEILVVLLCQAVGYVTEDLQGLPARDCWLYSMPIQNVRAQFVRVCTYYTTEYGRGEGIAQQQIRLWLNSFWNRSLDCKLVLLSLRLKGSSVNNTLKNDNAIAASLVPAARVLSFCQEISTQLLTFHRSKNTLRLTRASHSSASTMHYL